MSKLKVIEMKGHLGGFQLLKGRVPDGQCAECLTKHEVTQPHNQQSLQYQYGFMEKHGRWPTWYDALRHCESKMRESWIGALKAAGAQLGDDPGEPLADDELSEIVDLKVLSIRQPWAWLIVHGPKRFENREWAALNPAMAGVAPGQRFLIHAGKGMTRDEYAAGHSMAEERGVVLPAFDELKRGGIVGMATVVRWHYTKPALDWAFGTGIELTDVKPLEFMPCKGALGFFKPKF